MLELCKEYAVPVIMGSDAHFDTLIGEFSMAKKLLKCFRRDARENDLKMLELCKEYAVPVIMGSDAHFDTLIGEFSMAKKLLEEVDFPEELVLNRSVEALQGHVNVKL